MPTLAVTNTTDSLFQKQWDQLRRKLSLETGLHGNTERLEQVRRIVSKVRDTGDKAIAGLTAEYDKVELSPEQFRIPNAQLKTAHDQLDPQLLTALRTAIDNVRAYQKAIFTPTPADILTQGRRLGARYTPLNRVGICVPGASAPLVSTVIMTVVPAQVAGVNETAIISAPRHNGSIHPTILGLCHELGVTDVYRISGAQGVAALAYGTETIQKVDKIVGPSNWWGQLAKKEVYGMVDIDSFAGPSEVLVIADDSANPAWVAADLLSQAEHAPGGGLLLTDSDSLANNVAVELEKQLRDLPRWNETSQCIADYSLAVVTDSQDQTVELANEFAAEHLQLQCRNAEQLADRIHNAGAIFIGHHTPIAVGDYVAGPSHTLPTGSSARFFSALSANDFIKQTSLIAYNAEALTRDGPTITTIARAEGLDAHARSVTIRTEHKP